MRKLLILVGLFLVTSSLTAQVTKPKDTLKTETINVTKSFKPTVSDAYKIHENPSVQEDKTLLKESINYQIQSVPVASTFTPAKGKAQVLERPKRELIYDSFLSVGYGNFSSPFVESFLKSKIERENYLSLHALYNASKNAVSDAIIDDEYSNLAVKGGYHFQDNYLKWDTKLRFENTKINWYGLPSNITYNPVLLENVKTKQLYKTFGVDGNVEFKEFFIKKVTADLSYFNDDFDSKETQLYVSTEMDFPISTEKIAIEADVDLIKGSFEKEYSSITDLEHSFLKLGLKPSFQVLRENFMLNLGVNLFYSFDLEHRKSKLYSYPNVFASYKVMDNYLIPFIGVIGSLQTNSYKSLVDKNPFVSPNLLIKETDQTYNAFIGFKGNLSKSFDYQLKASLINEKDRAFFILNQSKTNGFNSFEFGYEAGNSFNLIYDDLKTIELEVSANLAITENFTLNSILTFNNYNTDNILEAFNLPTYKATVGASYIAKKWYANSTINLVGETKDYQVPYGFANILPSNQFIIADSYIIKNNAYVDLNVNAGYNFSNRLTAFVKLSNLLNSDYKFVSHYKTQGLQAIAGITYKFDL
ncbi:MAG: TonB-dependent receptor [Bacteroidetes bacterium]|nr:TonB-dependent receptor [Bacteroidota bacterium]